MKLERILTEKKVLRLERKGKIDLKDYNGNDYFKCNDTYYVWREYFKFYVSLELLDKEEDICRFLLYNNP